MPEFSRRGFDGPAAVRSGLIERGASGADDQFPHGRVINAPKDGPS
jgi:hypothetical protein